MKKVVLSGIRTLMASLAAIAIVLPLAGCGGSSADSAAGGLSRSQVRLSGETPAPITSYDNDKRRQQQDIDLAHIIVMSMSRSKPSISEMRQALQGFRSGSLTARPLSHNVFIVDVPSDYQQEGSSGIRRFITDLIAVAPDVFATPITADHPVSEAVGWANPRIAVGFDPNSITPETAEAIIQTVNPSRVERIPATTLMYRVEMNVRDGFQVQEIANDLAENPKTMYAGVSGASLTWGP
jgi:ABC-type amino acid transport substrate-binding protein